MKRYYVAFYTIAVSTLLLCGGCTAVLALQFPFLSWIPFFFFLLVLFGVILLTVRFRKICTGWINRISKKIDPQQEIALNAFPMPLLMVDEKGRLLYFNKLFRTQVMNEQSPLIDTPLDKIFRGFTMEDLTDNASLNLCCKGREYTAFVSGIRCNKQHCHLLYLQDDTELKRTAEEYEASRPVVLQICIDNMEEATEHLRAGERARISGTIETMLEDWITADGGALQKYGNERFVAITEHRHLLKMQEERFSILSRVRDAFPESDKKLTLSIGVGEGETVGDCRQMALRALDMALSRGGDQVAVKTENGYDFYGGHSAGVERRARVRTRIIADALRELILVSDRVFIMGHRISDLDCLGSGVALATIAKRMGKTAYVVVDRSATMAKQVMDRFEQSGKGETFIDPEVAEKLVTKDSLLIIVDTHSAAMLESEEIYRLANRVVVIDHHRRMVNHIEDTVLTYHEPSSSSTCEMVAELLPYLSDESCGRLVAEALMGGIMLDTRNFVIRTGVRTFEAAAYLRSLGVDTVSVKKMFAESLELYQIKSNLVADAQLYKGMAISVGNDDFSHCRTAAAQAADDLLSVQGVKASFVITSISDYVQISARSFGECNVQLIMEALGGGGHHTMAATQLKNVTVFEAREQLKAAIDRFEP